MIFITICHIICCKKVQSDSPFPSAMLLIAFNLLTSLFLNYFNIFKFFKSNFNKHFTKALDTMFNDNIQNYRFTMHFCISNFNWKVDNLSCPLITTHQRSCEKVTFLHVSVIPPTWGAWVAPTMHDPLQPCMSPSHAHMHPPAAHASSIRSVSGILLECLFQTYKFVVLFNA